MSHSECGYHGCGEVAVCEGIVGNMAVQACVLHKQVKEFHYLRELETPVPKAAAKPENKPEIIGAWIPIAAGADAHLYVEHDNIVIGTHKDITGAHGSYPTIALVMNGGHFHIQTGQTPETLKHHPIPQDVVARWLMSLLSKAEDFLDTACPADAKSPG